MFLLEAEPVQKAWQGLRDIWLQPSTMVEGHYWPMVYTSFWLEHKLWGYTAVGFHATNVLLHCVNTLLLWYLLKRMHLPGAWLAAAVFAVHPVHTEPVLWVISRKDLLGTLFYLLAFASWLRFRELRDGAGRFQSAADTHASNVAYAWLLLLFTAGMLSKSFVVTLPAALLVWAWWQQGRITGNDFKQTLPLFLLGAVIVYADLQFYFGRAVLDFEYSFAERVIIAAKSLWFYAGKLLWPWPLPIIYPRWNTDATVLLNWLPLLGAMMLAAGLYLARWRMGRGPLAAVLFFAITLSPVLGFADNSYMAITFVADRYQYLASAGILTLLTVGAVVGVQSFARKLQPMLAVAAVLLLVLYGSLTFQQAQVYRDPLTYFGHIRTLNPADYNGHYNYGLTLLNQGRYAEAEAPTLRAIEISPQSSGGYQNMAVITHNLGRYDETLVALRMATDLAEKQTAEQYYHLGHIAALVEQTDEAARYLLEALAMQPDYPDARNELLFVYLRAGRYAEALSLNPAVQQSLMRIAGTAFNEGRYADALENFAHVVALAPDDAAAHANLGAALGQLGRYEEALSSFERALQLDPGLEAAQIGREAALQQIGGP